MFSFSFVTRHFDLKLWVNCSSYDSKTSRDCKQLIKPSQWQWMESNNVKTIGFNWTLVICSMTDVEPSLLAAVIPFFIFCFLNGLVNGKRRLSISKFQQHFSHLWMALPLFPQDNSHVPFLSLFAFHPVKKTPFRFHIIFSVRSVAGAGHIGYV